MKYNTFFVLVLMLAFIVVPFSTSAATFISSDLQVGSSGSQVTELQLFLAADSSIYPEGKVTGYFGPLTKAAVMRFQTRHGISAIGKVGPQTRAKINTLGSVGLDVRAPSMSAVAISYASTSAHANASTTTSLSWSTNESAHAKLFYSTSPLVAQEASANFTEPAISGFVYADPSLDFIHTFPLVNVATNALYYYRAMSIDAMGNVSVSSQGSFVTGR